MIQEFVRVAAVVITSVVLLGCATGEKALLDGGAKPLTEGELKSMLTRPRTISWTNVSNGSSGTAEYKTDGSTQTSWGTGGDSGTFRVVGNSLCSKYPKLRGGAEFCQRIYKTGDNKYAAFLESGEPNTIFSFTN